MKMERKHRFFVSKYFWYGRRPINPVVGSPGALARDAFVRHRSEQSREACYVEFLNEG
jgi:hypothetical protein